jgi:hypothetical protein
MKDLYATAATIIVAVGTVEDYLSDWAVHAMPILKMPFMQLPK